jgi:hypothetical protein
VFQGKQWRLLGRLFDIPHFNGHDPETFARIGRETFHFHLGQNDDRSVRPIALDNRIGINHDLAPLDFAQGVPHRRPGRTNHLDRAIVVILEQSNASPAIADDGIRRVVEPDRQPRDGAHGVVLFDVTAAHGSPSGWGWRRRDLVVTE